jgi:hypothetical protein
MRAKMRFVLLIRLSVVHHVTQVLAPDCALLFLTDGFREYLTLDSQVFSG